MKRLTKYLGWVLTVLFILSLNLEGWADPQGGKGKGKSTQTKAKVVATKSNQGAKRGNRKAVQTKTKVISSKTTKATNRLTVRQKAPALRKEVIPARPNLNAVWIPGRWSWNYRLHQWYWIHGYWDLYPVGTLWVPGYWYYNDGLSIWISGYWVF